MEAKENAAAGDPLLKIEEIIARQDSTNFHGRVWVGLATRFAAE